MTTPRTAAGRALLAYELATGADGIEAERVISDLLGRHWEQRDAILAIEAEARVFAQSEDSRATARLVAEARAAGYRDGLADGSDAGRVASVYEWLGPCCTHPTPGCIECGFQPEAPAIDALREAEQREQSQATAPRRSSGLPSRSPADREATASRGEA